MLDPRVFRAALLPVLLVLIVVAFSLEDRPGPLRSAFAPERLRRSSAPAQLLDGLNRAHPFRRAGSSGDAALARTVAGLLDRALPPRVDVRTRAHRGETLDGDSTLLSVTAQEPGSSPRPQIVLVAQRDSAHAGTKADLSGTRGADRAGARDRGLEPVAVDHVRLGQSARAAGRPGCASWCAGCAGLCRR